MTSLSLGITLISSGLTVYCIAVIIWHFRAPLSAEYPRWTRPMQKWHEWSGRRRG